jgi:hypothetical protein
MCVPTAKRNEKRQRENLLLNKVARKESSTFVGKVIGEYKKHRLKFGKHVSLCRPALVSLEVQAF